MQLFSYFYRALSLPMYTRYMDLLCNAYCFKLTVTGDITEGALDLAVLFDHGLLRDAASKIK